ncbi:Uncharacterised protein [Serratia fonticola]|nr:Uncharacterised protein [Serratia fonticola]
MSNHCVVPIFIMASSVFFAISHYVTLWRGEAKITKTEVAT